MLFKIVLLTCLGISTASTDNTKLKELNKLMKTLDCQMQDLVSNSTSRFRSLHSVLGYYTGQARKAFIGNMTIAAQPYWLTVAEAKTTAEEQGRNIDVCVETSNSEIYATNNTFVTKAVQNIRTELAAGQTYLSDIYAAIRNDPIKKLDEMQQRVDGCNEEVCAVELSEQFNKEYSEISSRLETSVNEARYYAYREFMKKTEQYVIVPQEYHNEILKIMSAFEKCIKQK
ncbi:uncharacterized protein LOC143204431 [Rhynchophorus ferrugineus]|uniref:uncharacterized protein LOC143204431 n=1 Tax=Rhynchophorus ferrugineus TaxID=354439 RepID=UPI003FCDFC33